MIGTAALLRGSLRRHIQMLPLVAQVGGAAALGLLKTAFLNLESTLEFAALYVFVCTVFSMAISGA